MQKRSRTTEEKILILGDVFLDIFQTTDILKISLPIILKRNLKINDND